MKKCWANKISPCSEKLSKEHLVSKGIFTSNIITITGQPWSEVGENVDIGINSFTSKILCTKHNNEFSTLDKQGIEAFTIFKQFDKLHLNRSKMKPRRWNVINSKKIDGLLLERWLLKTTINLSLFTSKPKPLGLGFNSTNNLPSELVEIVFGKRYFPDGMGLHVAFGDKQKFDMNKDEVFFNSIEQNDRVAGAFFSLRNFRFFLSLTDIKDESFFEGLSGEWGKPLIKRRPSTVNVKIGPNMSHKIRFKWHIK